MSHHFGADDSSEFLNRFRKEMADANTPPLGETGKFPNGKIDESDRGEIRMAVAGDIERQLVHIDFGDNPIKFVSMTPKQAIELAQSLIQKARGTSSEPLTVNLY